MLKHKTIRLFLLLLFVSLQWSIARIAQAAVEQHIDHLQVSQQLSLADVLNKALLRAPQQASLRAEKTKVEANTRVANSYLSASPSISVYHQNDMFTSARNERDWMVQLALPLWMPNEKAQSLQLANQSVEQLALNKERLRLWVAGQLRSAVWDVAENQAMVALYEDKLTTIQKIETTIEKAFEAGELAKTDLMLIQQEQLQVKQEVIDVKAELMHAHYAYTQLTGLEAFPADIEEVLSELDDFEASAAWQFALANVEGVEQARKLAERQRNNRPQLTLNARSSRGAFDAQYNQSLGVQFQIPLDADVSRAPRLAAAEQAVGEALTLREQLRLRLQKNLHEAEHNLLVSRQALNLAKEQVALARQHADLAKKAYQLGEIDLIRLLHQQAQTFEAEKKHVKSKMAVLRHTAYYNQAVGVIP